MSVIASKRNTAKTQYIFSFYDLAKYTEGRLEKIPKRKYRWLVPDIISTMHVVETYLLQTENRYYQYGIKLYAEPEQARIVIRKLASLQKPLLALWNIERYSDDEMICWCEQVNDVIRQLYKMGHLEPQEPVFILSHEAINRMEFMAKICELHRLIYSKTISLPYTYRETKGNQLMELADEALFRISDANRKAPTTKEMYERRKENLSAALQCLKSMQVPMLSLFSLMNYTNETMVEISGLLTDEIKLISGLIKSDEKRFGGLQ